MSSIFSLFGALAMKNDEWFYEVYIGNITDMEYPTVTMQTGWFASDDENLIETKKVYKSVGALGAHKLLSIDTIHWMERDFVIWYEVMLYNAKWEGIKYAFEIDKWCPEEDIIEIPLTTKKWWLIELERKP